MAAAFRLLPSITRIMHSRQLITYGLPVIETFYKELKTPTQNKTELIKKDNQIVINNLIELKKINFSFPKSDKDIYSLFCMFKMPFVKPNRNLIEPKNKSRCYWHKDYNIYYLLLSHTIL